MVLLPEDVLTVPPVIVSPSIVPAVTAPKLAVMALKLDTDNLPAVIVFAAISLPVIVPAAMLFAVIVPVMILFPLIVVFAIFCPVTARSASKLEVMAALAIFEVVSKLSSEKQHDQTYKKESNSA